MSLSMQNGGGGNSSRSSSDMYRDILKELGAEDHTMDYLFDESSSSEGDHLLDTDTDDEDEEDSAVPSSAAARHSNLETKTTPLATLLSPGDAESDDELLHQWESEVEDGDEVDEIYKEEMQFSSPSLSNGGVGGANKPTPVDWKVKLEEATVQQQELMSQMRKLQSVQKESSPSKQKQNQAAKEHNNTTTPGDHKRSIEIEENNIVTSPVLQEISMRNAQLQDEWQTQQQQTAELQTKLNSLQTHFHDQQTQWKKDSEQLFSPARSSTTTPTKIPRWGKTPTPSSAKTSTQKVTFVDTTPPSSSLVPPSLKQSSQNQLAGKSEEPKRLQTPRPQEVPAPELDERDARIRELEAQWEGAKKLQSEQTKQLDDVTDRLKRRDADYQALLVRHETDRSKWEDEKRGLQMDHQREKDELSKQLEGANDLFRKQVTLNQEQREELQELKQNSWNSEVEDTQNQIKIAIAQQREKTTEFQSRIKELEDRHEEERQSWESRLEGYREQLEESTAEWKSRLEDANGRYVDLETRYLKETREWQDLLEMDMTETIDESNNADKIFRSLSRNEPGNKVGVLSPIPREKSMGDAIDQSSMSDSSLDIETVPSQSMENIDNLMDELGRMDAERTALLDEINRPDMDEKEVTADGQTTGVTVGDRPYPVETPGSSPQQNESEGVSSNFLDTTSDSVVLDRTLSLLNNLKEMMTSNENVNDRETSVLEHLEVLSELMQDQSGYQSLLSSPRRRKGDATETSLDVSRDEEHDTTWMSGAQASMSPWSALVAELKSRCEFLERDRRELTRITEEILRKERASHRVEIEAAVATANREANEKLHQRTQEYNRALRAIYQRICYRCQQCVYSML